MSNIIKKIRKSVSLIKGITLKKDPTRKGHTGFLSCRELRLLDVPLIYGAQGSVFENRIDPKPWQHGQHYDKANLSGHPLDLLAHVDHEGNPVYVRLRSGQIVNTTKNRNVKKLKSVKRSIKKIKALSRKQAVCY